MHTSLLAGNCSEGRRSSASLALPRWEIISPTEQFSPTIPSFSLGTSSFWRLTLAGHVFKWVEIIIYFPTSSLLGLFQVRASGLRQRLLLVTGHWCCCWELKLKTNPLHPNVSHLWTCLTSFDLFYVKYSFSKSHILSKKRCFWGRVAVEESKIQCREWPGKRPSGRISLATNFVLRILSSSFSFPINSCE